MSAEYMDYAASCWGDWGADDWEPTGRWPRRRWSELDLLLMDLREVERDPLARLPTPTPPSTRVRSWHGRRIVDVPLPEPGMPALSAMTRHDRPREGP